MKETLISYISCKDEKFLWCYDEIICTLSRIDLRTLQADCILTPMQILVHKNYEVRKIIAWKNKIIILPKEIKHKWIIYDKLSGKVEYDIYFAEKYTVTDAFLIEENLVLIPISIKDPIIIVDMEKRKIAKKIEFPNTDDLTEGYIWNAKVDQGDICFLIHDSFFYGRLSNNELSLIKIEVSEQLICADFYMNMGWAVDGQGRNIYSFNKKGQLLGIYPVEIGTYVARIVVKDRFVFLLPYKKNAIMIFDTNGKFIKKVSEGAINLKFIRVFDLTNYWDYVETDTYVFFLPLKYSLQIINIKTLMEEQKSIEYTSTLSTENYENYYQYARIMRDRLYFLMENSMNSNLKKYLELISINNNMKKTKIPYCTKHIWEVLNNK